MKHYKLRRVLAMLLALMMTLAMGICASAGTTYSITVTNDPSSTNVSIAGKTFSAYKIFDATYSEEAADGAASDWTNYAYSISSKNSDGTTENPWFTQVLKYMGGGTTEVTANETTGVYTGKGITLTPTGSDNTKYVVTTTTTGTGAFDARAFADYLGAYINTTSSSLTADGNVTASGNNLTTDSSTGKESTTISNLTSAGYYVVMGEGTADKNQTVVAAAALTTTDPTATVELKADAPTVDKDIIETDSNGDETSSDYNDAAIGDTINYKVTSAVPDMTGYSKYFFVVTDTLSKGLTLNTTNGTPDVTIKIGDTTLTKNTDYTVTSKTNSATGETTLKIVFKNFIDRASQKGETITITYSATLNENAVIGNAGNKNSVELTYSNNPNVTPKGENEPIDDDPKGETPGESVTTYTTGIQLTKVNSATPAVRLTGAKFKLEGTKLNTVVKTYDEYTVATDTSDTTKTYYYKLKDGTYTTTEPTTGEGGSSDNYESTETKYTKETKTEKTTKSGTEAVSAEATVGSDGVLCFNGLSEGEYTITEIKAPDGYNMLTSPLKVKIELESKTDETTGTTTYNWKATNVENGGTDDATWTVNNEGIITTSVVNSTGSELPSTGGIGTTIFYVVGGLLAAGAAIALIVKKRMSGCEE